MLQLNPILDKLTQVQAQTAMMAQLTQAAQGNTITLNRQDLQQVFADIEETVSGVCTQLSDFDEQPETYIDPHDQASCTSTEVRMTEPSIVIRNMIERVKAKSKNVSRHYYVPSISEERKLSATTLGLCRAYGVELPVQYHNIGIESFAEKVYTDENNDEQRVLVPLFKNRPDGEHFKAFYQRVGLPIPPLS